MKLKEGTLHLLRSINPPVFPPSMDIRYTVAPKVGRAFLFGFEHGLDRPNLSTVKKITRFKGFIVIQTLNSYYVLVYGGKSEC